MQAYMTQPRKRLLSYLHGHADETLSAGQIAQDLPEISVSAVYRNLSALEKDGAVQENGGKAAGFPDPHRGHHGHGAL